ncbi:MAG: Zn-ribbon domain-containing OB-fold protein [Acidimicrobiales bacterium]
MDGDPRLLGSECPGCGALHFPRSDTCPYCGDRPSTACELPSRGTLWAWTTVHVPPPGYHGPVPFGFGVVELDGRIRVVARLTEADAGLLRQDQAVHLVLTEVGEEDGTQMVSWAFAPSGRDRR